MNITVIPATLGLICDSCSILVVSEPGPPEGLNAVPLNTTAVRVSWNAPETGVTAHLYNVMVGGGDSMNYTSTDIDVVGLQESTLHNISVRTYSSYGKDACTTDACAATGAFNSTSSWTYANAVEALKVTPTSKSLTIDWTRGEVAGLKGYVILVMDMDDSEKCVLEAHQHKGPDFPYEHGCVGNDNTTEQGPYTTDKVLSCSNYSITVYTKNEAGNSENSTTDAKILVGEPIQQIGNVVLTPYQRSLNVTWGAVDGPGRCPIVEYLIEYNYTDCTNTDGTVLTNTTTVTGDVLTAKLTSGIRPYWNYTVAVSARTVQSVSSGNSSSEPSEIRTLIDVPGKPSILNVTDGKNNTVVLDWDEPEPCDRNGPIDTYNVSYSCINLAENAQEKLKDYSKEVHTKTHTLDIGAFRNCTFSVAAINVDEQNVDLQGPTNSQVHKTPEDSPSKVVNVTATATGPTSVHLSWELPSEPNGDILSYTISYTPLRFADGQGYPEAPSNSTNITELDRERLITNLHEYTTYAFTVLATTAGGAGMSSDVENVDTTIGAPLQAENITYTTKTKDMIEVAWSMTKRTGPTKYMIYAETIDGSNKANSSEIKGYNTTTGAVTGLSPYTNYTITVVAMTDTGNSTANGGIQRTDEDVPESVKNANLTSTNTSISVSWEPPIPNGVILRYTVSYKALTYADGLALPADDSVKTVNATHHNSTVLYDQISPFTYYEVKIYGWTSKGMANSSSPFYVNTTYGDPSPVSNIVLEKAASRLLTVSWTKPENRTGNTSYEISAKDETWGDPVEPVTVQSYSRTKGTLTVKPYRNYTVSVRTISTGIEGGSLPGELISAKDIFETMQDRPDGIPNPRVETADKNNCTARLLKWSPLNEKQRNGLIKSYRIILEGGGEKRHDETIDSIPEKEIGNIPYTYDIPVKAGLAYIVTVSAATNVDEGPKGNVTDTIGYCAPPFPDGESLEDPTQTVKPVKDVEPQQNKIRVELSKIYFTNNAGGPITFQGIVVAQSEKADSDAEGGTGRILNAGEFEQLYTNWSTARSEENMPPFKIDVASAFKKSIWKRSAPPKPNDESSDEYSDEVVEFTIGSTDCNENVDAMCNGPLNAGKPYKFRAVSCTQGGCTMTSYSPAVETAPRPSNAGAIAAGVIVPILILALVAGIIFFMYRQDLGPFAGKTMRAAQYHHDSGHDNPGIRMEDVPPNPVPLPEFPDHVAKRHQNSDLLFAEEYKLLKELSPRMTWNAAELPYNRNKNRYNNILPYDHSRVKLLAVDEEDEAGSDYINANFMPGYNSKREFIANQGPLASTKDDFWRLVWEQNVPIIVMVTKCIEKGRHKCEQYWPNDNEPVYYGDLQVQVRSESVLNNYTIRIIDISMGEIHRSVHHFNFESWPDFGCPETTDALLKFVMTVRSHRSGQTKGPLVIHCSAGVGRTGTFVCVDRLLQQMRDHGTVDVFGTILEMRRYRTNMVQTEDQYIYIHDCLRDALSQGIHKQYPTNNPQLPPDLGPPQTTAEDDDQHLYENVEISAPQAQIVSDKRVSNGNSTGL